MKDFLRLFSGLFIVGAIIFIAAFYFESFITRETVEVTVTQINEQTTSGGDKYWLITTKNEIFENRDHTLHNKENAYDVAKRLKVGGKYKIEVVGFDFGIHIPLFLEHRNIIRVVDEIEVKKPKIRRLE